ETVRHSRTAVADQISHRVDPRKMTDYNTGRTGHQRSFTRQRAHPRIGRCKIAGNTRRLLLVYHFLKSHDDDSGLVETGGAGEALREIVRRSTILRDAWGRTVGRHARDQRTISAFRHVGQVDALLLQRELVD